VKLTPAQFAIVVSLLDGDRHGYAIMKECGRSGSGLQLGPGTLYRSIGQLMAAGLICEAGDHGSRDGTRRRLYRLTSAGRAVARDEALRWAQLVDRARRGGLIPAASTAGAG
jgi:DNA-binding PadR family transcriptional regulator